MDIGNLRMVQFRVSYSKNAAPVTLSLTADSLPENAMGITELTFTDDLIVNAKIILTRSHYERTPFLNDSTESRFVVLLRSMTRTKADSRQVTCQSLAPWRVCSFTLRRHSTGSLDFSRSTQSCRLNYEPPK